MSMKESRQFTFNLQDEFPHLPSAPIVEAVIHWRARINKTLVPADLKEQLVERLPDYLEFEQQHELQLEAQFDSDGSSTQIRRDNWRGFRCNSTDKKHVAQFHRDGFIFSRLEPYEDWIRFSLEGLRLWQVFTSLAEPAEIQRLGVRFINRIPLTAISEVNRFLAKPPRCLEPIGLLSSGFFQRNAYQVPGHSFQINVVQTVQPSAPGEAEGFGLILDVDVSTTQAFDCDDQSLKDRLTKMRWLKDKAFFSLLKPAAIKRFQRT